MIAECKADGIDDQKAIMDCVRLKQKANGTTDSDTDTGIAAVNAHYGGLQKQKHGGFIYGDITFPFVL